MTLVKGPNGLIVDVAPSVASGLIGGGHVVAVKDGDVEVEKPSTDDADTEPEDAADVEVNEPDEDSARPAGNASRGDWEAYALSQGFAEEQLEGLKQSEIRALFD